MSVFKDVVKALQPLGDVELPDGKSYTVREISVGELIELNELAESQAEDAKSLPVLLRIAQRVTGAPKATIHALTRQQLSIVITMANLGVENVANALRASAEGKATAPVAGRSARQTLRKSR